MTQYPSGGRNHSFRAEWQRRREAWLELRHAAHDELRVLILGCCLVWGLLGLALAISRNFWGG